MQLQLPLPPDHNSRLRQIAARIRRLRFKLKRETRELLVLILGILPAWAGSSTSDPWIFLACISVSWIALIILCLSHRSSWLLRSTVIIIVTVFFCFVGYRFWDRAQVVDLASAQYPWLSVEEAIDPGQTDSNTGEPSDVLKVTLSYKNHGTTSARDIHCRVQLPAIDDLLNADTHDVVAPGESRSLTWTIRKEFALQAFRAVQTDGSLTKIDISFYDLNGTKYGAEYSLVWLKQLGTFGNGDTKVRDGFLALKRPSVTRRP